MNEYLSQLINVSHISEQRLLSFPAFWTQMIEIFRFPDKFCVFTLNPEYCREPRFFLLSPFLLLHPVTGKEDSPHILVYPRKNLSVVTVKDIRKKKVQNGSLFTSYSPHHPPMNKENVSGENLICVLTFSGALPPPRWHAQNYPPDNFLRVCPDMFHGRHPPLRYLSKTDSAFHPFHLCNRGFLQSQKNICITGFTRAVCTSAVPRSRQARPAAHRVRRTLRAR
jgi:hypothetical protein